MPAKTISLLLTDTWVLIAVGAGTVLIEPTEAPGMWAFNDSATLPTVRGHHVGEGDKESKTMEDGEYFFVKGFRCTMIITRDNPPA